ncbi:MAG TPA: transposase [Pyrinomonadaceae bacterium]|jgi:transposase
MDIRQQKGIAIATKAAIKKDGNLWLVPSQAGHGKYKVDADAKHCTCPDYEFRQASCKHIHAVQHTIEKIEKTKTTVTENGKTTVTETVKIKRQTYRQEWPAYYAAQTQEKAQFQYLLHQLCNGVGEPAQRTGRPRLPLEDMIFAMAFKVYSTFSGRRFMSDLRDANAKGYISKLPCYNSIFNYFEDEMLTPHLLMLIEESSLPLQAIERDFAVDSTGLSGCRFVQWISAKYGDGQLMESRDWIKMHLICGTQTNIVTAVEISEKYRSDSPYFKPLVEATARNFQMREVSADKGYDSFNNRCTTILSGAAPYIPYRSGEKHKPSASGKGELWKRMYHFYAYNTERFMASYHKRSNVETTFSMIKAKFGDSVRSRTKTAQINEALCKVLCHNICCLIQSMYELNLKPKFWAQVA